jgi:putative endonuclease
LSSDTITPFVTLAKARAQGNRTEQGTPMKQPCVYILASRRNGTLYIGVTSDVVRRVWQHRSGAIDGFTAQYGVHRLVYAEFHATMVDAIHREKCLKVWRRVWKLRLIEEGNPQWRDLYDDFVPETLGPRLREGDE